MRKINVGIIGIGTVGGGVVRTLLSKKKMLEERSGVSINLARVADRDARARKGIRIPKKIFTKDPYAVIEDRNIDIVVELIGGIHPAKEIVLGALMLGKHVVTANKALLAEYGKEIFATASRFRSRLGFEASVGGGIPVINALGKRLVSNDIEVVYGILNGTSNFILSRMSEENVGFKQALEEARARGIAEKNPKLDISGTDSCHKLAILALLGFGLSVKPRDIYTEGIEDIDLMDIQYARQWGYSIKPLAIARRANNKLDLRVHPSLVSSRNILASVKDENNAIYIRGDMVGDILFYGRGAGSFPTASSVISDIVEIARTLRDGRANRNTGIPRLSGDLKKVRNIKDLTTRYYVRFSAIDKPGVLAGISSVLAQNKISIATVTQKERKKGQPVPIVMLTHYANEGMLNNALKRIDRLSFITQKTVRIRIVR